MKKLLYMMKHHIIWTLVIICLIGFGTWGTLETINSSQQTTTTNAQAKVEATSVTVYVTDTGEKYQK